MTLEAETESMAAEPLASSTAAVEVPPPPFGASSKLTQEIYSAFVQAFPDLFADPKPVAEKDNEENDGGGAEGENEGNGSPNKAEASPAKSAASGDEGKDAGEGGSGGGTPGEPVSEEPDVYEEKVRVVNKTCEDFVTYVSEIEGHIRDAQQKAEEEEASALSTADELYTPQWRDTGLPEMPSFLTGNLSEDKLEGMGLLNPKSLWRQVLDERDAKSAPPRTIEYFENEAKGYLKTTNNLKVRSRILATYPKKVTYKSFSGLTDQELIKKARESEARLKEMSKKMSAAQWDEEVKILQRMKQKLNYTQNPRYAEQDKRRLRQQGKQGKPQANDKQLFKIEPDQIEFHDYELGGMYSMQLRVRNVSGLSRRARFLPPRSKYFSIANVEFPGSKNLLAPGMCCRCELYFQPDSLADYDDYFSIETDMSTFRVQVAARRPSPNLSVPKTMDCGPCLLGHTLVTEFRCVNSGGRGSFTVVREEDWPTDQVDVANESSIEMAPFTFGPASFKLYNGDETVIKIGFLPEGPGDFVRKFKMLCDNCKIETFSIVGLGVKLDITLESVDGKPVHEEEKKKKLKKKAIQSSAKKTKGKATGSQVAKPKTSKEPSPCYSRKVWFGEVVPGAKHPRSIVVRNNTPIPLAYHWTLENSAGQEAEQTRSTKTFQISPMSGVLGAHENSEFLFVFEPENIESYGYKAALMIESHSHTTQGSLLSKVIELDLEGNGKGVAIAVSPALLEFTGTMLHGKQYERDVTVTNRSKAPAKISWQDLPPNVRVFPMTSVVPPEDAIECDVQVLATELGRTDVTISNQVEHGPILPLRLVYTVDGPKIKFLSPKIDFGLVQETKSVTAAFELQNCSDADAEFELSEVEPAKGKERDWSFAFSEAKGVLGPNERRSFELTLTCGRARALRTVIRCGVLVGGVSCSEQKISARADVVAPYACLSSTKIDVGVTYLNVAVERTVKIRNLTQLPSSFEWLPDDLLSEEDATKVQVLVSPQKGTISPGKTEEIDIEVIPVATGPCSVILPCELDGMREPLGLQINTKIEGISVRYEIKDGSGSKVASPKGKGLSLEFGDRLPIGRRASMTLVVHNQSAIRAPVDLCFEKFGLGEEVSLLSGDATSQGMGTGNMSEMMLRSSDMDSIRTQVRRNKRRTEMSKTLRSKKLETVLLTDAVVSKIDSRRGQDRDSTLLQEAGSRGVVFLVSPAQGTLEPWGTAEFQVTCVNNMCGTYFDTLMCEIGGLPAKPIPVRAGVVGSPLALQLQVYSTSQVVDNRSLNVNWGDLCVCSATQKRKFWVSNTSPFDMRVDWSMHLLGSGGASKKPAMVSLEPVAGGGVSVTIEERGVEVKEGKGPFKLLTRELVVPAGTTKPAEIEFAGSVPKKFMAVVRGKQRIEGAAAGKAKRGNITEAMVGTFHPHAAPPCEPLGGLRLSLVANTIKPSLDTQGLESLKFVCHSCVPLDDPSYSRSAAFTNTNSTTVMFTLETEGPYKILSVRTSYPQPKVQEKVAGADVYVVPPSENVDITVQYRKQVQQGEPEGLTRQVGGSLKIAFLPQSGTRVLPGAEPVCVQDFPMLTTVLYPKISLSQDSVNFENVHPNAPKVMEITLINPTLVDATWQIVDEEHPKPKTPQRRRSSAASGTTRRASATKAPDRAHPAFEIHPTSGVIAGRGIGQPQRQKVTIRFHPKHDLQYKRQYRVRVKKGLGTFFALKGSGSYNEVLESDLALSLS